MAIQKLKLVKTGKKQVKRTSEAVKKQLRMLDLQPPALTPAEQVEVARFRALTLKRAAHQALVRQTIAQLDDLETDAAA